mgnify:CR=1 FL=1
MSDTIQDQDRIRLKGARDYSIAHGGVKRLLEEIFEVDVVITSAQILAMNASPVELVPAPGSDKYLEFLGAQAIMDSAVAYAGVGATEDLVVRYTDGSGAIVSTTLETTGFIDQTTDQIRTHKAISTDVTPVVNAALVAQIINGEITTGTGTLRYRVRYKIHETKL